MKLDKEKCFRQIDLFGGKGEVLVWDLLRGAPAGQIQSVLACDLVPGGSVGAHRQAETDEVMIVHSGTGTAWVGDKSHPLNPGSVVHLPLGHFLRLENSSQDEPLHYYIVKTSP